MTNTEQNVSICTASKFNGLSLGSDDGTSDDPDMSIVAGVIAVSLDVRYRHSKSHHSSYVPSLVGTLVQGY